MPTFFTRYLIYGSAFESGYVPLRRDGSGFIAAFITCSFASNHGCFWEPILLLAIVRLFLFWLANACRRPDSSPPSSPFTFSWPVTPIGRHLFYGQTAFSFSHPFFILGLAVSLQIRAAKLVPHPPRRPCCGLRYFAVLRSRNRWHIFQRGGFHSHSRRGPTLFSEMAHNQFFVVTPKPAQRRSPANTSSSAAPSCSRIEDPRLQQLKNQSSASLRPFLSARAANRLRPFPSFFLSTLTLNF